MTHLNPFRLTMALSNSETPAAAEPSVQESGGLPAWARRAPADVPLARPREVEVRVGFSNHTFTTKKPDPRHGPEYRYHYSPEGRYFCPDRYRLSFLLPDLVRDFRNRNCFRAKYENFLILDIPEMLDDGFEYRIFFILRPSGEAGALALIIESAYSALIGSGSAPAGVRDKPIGFRALANQVLDQQNGLALA